MPLNLVSIAGGPLVSAIGGAERDPETPISVTAVRELLEASARAANVEDFGLQLARGRRLANLGPLSIVLREELKQGGVQALRAGIRRLAAHRRGGVGGRLSGSCAVAYDHIRAQRGVAEAEVHVALRVLRHRARELGHLHRGGQGHGAGVALGMGLKLFSGIAMVGLGAGVALGLATGGRRTPVLVERQLPLL